MSSTPPSPQALNPTLQGEPSTITQQASTQIRATCTHSRDGRIIVLCADGTANKFGEKSTNVVEFLSRIVKNKKQSTFYISGIGTHNPSPVGRILDMAFANSFETNILIAYKWLAENYEEGDRIFMFGFSRGAYQVRVIAGMIEQVGLIYPGNTTQLPDVYKLYMSTTDRSSGKGSKERTEAIELCETFKSAFSWPNVKVHFVGVWDTVASVGITMRDSLPETIHGMTHVCHFRHALALDEKRVKFLPEYASGSKFSNANDSRTSGDVKEVWFAGSHSDIGGGNVINRKLKTFGPALRWMTYEAMSHGLQMHPYSGKWVAPNPTRSLKAAWPVVELLPLHHPSYRNGEVTRIPHLGMPRRIQENQRIHESVFMLMGIHKEVVALLDKKGVEEESHHTSTSGTTSSTPRTSFIHGLIWLVMAILAGLWTILCSPGGGAPLYLRPGSGSLNRNSEGQQFMMIIAEIWNSASTTMLHYLYDISRCIVPLRGDPQTQMPINRKTPYVPYGALAKGGSWDNYALLAKLIEHDPFTDLESIISRIDDATVTEDLERFQSEVDVLATSISSGSNETLGQLTEVFGALPKLLSALKFMAAPRSEDVRNSVILTLFSALASLPPDSAHKVPLSTFRNIAYKLNEISKSEIHSKLLAALRHADLLLAQYDLHKGNTVKAVAIPATDKVLSASYRAVIVQTNGTERSIDMEDEFLVAFQANGSKFATGDKHGNVTIWDVESGKKLQTLEGPSGTISSLAFSPDGSKIAVGSEDGTIRVWDMETGQDLFGAMEGHTHRVLGLAFSPDGTRLASGSIYSTVRLWDEAGKSNVLEGHNGLVLSVAFSKDHIISGSWDKTIRVWNADSGDLVRVLHGHTEWIFCMAFSPDFKHVASGSDNGTARLWDVSSGEVLAIYDIGDWVKSIAFSFDGKQIVTGSWRGKVV